MYHVQSQPNHAVFHARAADLPFWVGATRGFLRDVYNPPDIASELTVSRGEPCRRLDDQAKSRMQLTVFNLLALLAYLRLFSR